MAPHCDTLDGPVVTACRTALKTGNVNYVLPFVPKTAEEELSLVFNKVLKARELGADAAEVADLWFFETEVRLHREGEGANYTGLKPAGLDWGPVVPLAEEDIKKEDPTETIEFLKNVVEGETRRRFQEVMSKKDYDLNDVDSARDYTETMLHFILSSHHLYKFVISDNTH